MAVCSEEVTRVAIAVIENQTGEVLLSQRPVGKPLAGYWEFPGGKCEPGETPEEALSRELLEELGIEPIAVQPLIEIPWTYPKMSVRLSVFLVSQWRGQVAAREGQVLRWQSRASLDIAQMPPANRGIIHALQLPPWLLVTPDVADDDKVSQRQWLAALDQSVRALATQLVPLVQLRLRPGRPQTLLREAIKRVRSAGGKVLLNGSLEQARALGTDGIHLNRARLAEWDAASRPTLPPSFLVSTVVHNADELAAAERIQADIVLISPVKPTASHPGAAVLGWSEFAALAARATMPAYALGGMSLADLHAARCHGGQGIAAISAFWRSDELDQARD